MSKTKRSKRDGTGPFKESFRILNEKKKVGRRRAAGYKCPKK